MIVPVEPLEAREQRKHAAVCLLSRLERHFQHRAGRRDVTTVAETRPGLRHDCARAVGGPGQRDIAEGVGILPHVQKVLGEGIGQ
jgi:hypothetical protein